MLPKQHIILGLIFATVLLLLFPQIGLIGFLIIIFSTVLIDVDHYLFYVWYKKDYSLRNCYRWFIKKSREFRNLSKEQKKKINCPPIIFHGFEALIILIILSFFSKIFIYILIGFLFHEFLDIINIISGGCSPKHSGSQIYNILNYTNS